MAAQRHPQEDENKEAGGERIKWKKCNLPAFSVIIIVANKHQGLLNVSTGGGGGESDHSPKKTSSSLSLLASGAPKLDFGAESCFYHPKRQRIRAFQAPGDDFFEEGPSRSTREVYG